MTKIVAETASFRVVITDDEAMWFQRQIIQSGPRRGQGLIWVKRRAGRWDTRHGFWAIPIQVPAPELKALEKSVRDLLEVASCA